MTNYYMMADGPDDKVEEVKPPTPDVDETEGEEDDTEEDEEEDDEDEEV